MVAKVPAALGSVTSDGGFQVLPHTIKTFNGPPPQLHMLGPVLLVSC